MGDFTGGIGVTDFFFAPGTDGGGAIWDLPLGVLVLDGWVVVDF